MAKVLVLQVRHGESETTHRVEAEIVKIGRLASAHVRLEDPKVSRIHAVFERAPDGTVSVIDMGSAQGTLVNGKRVSKQAVREGDRIVVGDTILELLGEGAAAAPAKQAAQEQVEAAPEPQAEPAPTPAPAQVAEPAPAPTPAAAAVGATVVAIPSQAAPSRTHGASATATSPWQLPVPWPRDDGGRDLSLHVRLFWGDQPLDALEAREVDEITLGGSEASFFVDPGSLPADPFPIARREAEGWVLCLPDDPRGGIVRGGDVSDFSALVREGKARTGEGGGREVDLPEDAAAWIDLGNVRAELCFRPRRRPVATRWSDGLDYAYLNVLLVAAFLVAATVVGFQNIEHGGATTADDLFANQARFTKLLLEPPEKAKDNHFLQKLQELKAPAAKTVRAPGEEGKAGKRDAAPAEKRSAPQAIDPDDKEIIKNQGVLSMLGRGGAGLSTILGTGGLGGELKGAIGGISGKTVGDAHGFGGLGLRGTGPGGGAVGETVSVGAIGTRGRGGGSAGFGSGVGGLGKKGSAEVKIDASAATVQGTIDKELIRRVIQANHGKFKYCYESELVRKPSLAGRIAIQFQINTEGKVTLSRVASTTMGNATVENCVASRIRQLVFPMPQGGGSALVTYPFVFHPPGE